MQLSSRARKAVATGLAASTILWASIGLVPTFASAAVHSEGCLVLSGGTVWMITGGTRRGFTSAEVFQSWGYNFSQVVVASAEDVALPVGPIMVYANGTLVKGPNDQLVYLVTAGQKRPFVSGAVFLGLGFSFANIQLAPANTFADLPVGANLDSTTIAHPQGVQVISNGAVWWMDNNGRRGFSSAAQFQAYGYKFSHVVAANSYDLALPNLGDVPAFPSCTGGGSPPPVSGSFSVSLASDTPIAGSIIADSTNGGQALAPIMKLNFTGGSSGATVTSLTLTRIGVGNDSNINNAYLYDGNTRLAQMQSISGGKLLFVNNSGLFTVSSNTVRSITLKIDVTKTATAGQTYGFSILSASDVVGSGNINPSGSFPINSNLQTVATVSDLGKLTVANVTPTANGTVDPGQTGYEVWRFSLQATNQNLQVSYLALTNLGSASGNQLQNFKLMDGGTQVGPTVASQDANRMVIFDLSGAPLNITSGVTKQLSLKADIVGGSTLTYQFSFQNSSDIQVKDLQYNVSLFPFPSGGTVGTWNVVKATGVITINSGSITVVKATDSPSGNAALNGTNITLGKYTFTANGEGVKVSTLNARALVGGAGSGKTIKNLRLYVNGVQIGTTQTTVTSSAVQSSTSGTADANDVQFNLGNSLVVQPGTPVVVTLVADLTGTAVSADAVVTSLVQGSSNAQGQTSLTGLSAPGSTIAGNTLIVAAGSLTGAINSSVAAMTVVTGATNQLVGSVIITAGAAEAEQLTSVVISDTDGTVGEGLGKALNNIKLFNGVTQLGAPVVNPSTVAGTTFTFNISPAINIPSAGSLQLDLRADILSGATLTGNSDSIKVTTATSSVGATTTTTHNLASNVTAQVYTLAGAGTLTLSLDSSTPTDQQVVMNSSQNTMGVWKLSASVAENLNVTQLIFVDNSPDANSVNNARNLKLYADGLQVGNTVTGLSKIRNNTLSANVGGSTTAPTVVDGTTFTSTDIGYYIVMTSGTNIGKVGRVVSVATNTLTLAAVGAAWTTGTDNGATYKEVSAAVFSGINKVINANDYKLFTLKADTSDSVNASVGLKNRFMLGTLITTPVTGAGTDTVVATGASSGAFTALANVNTTYQANNSYAYRTKMGVALNSASPSGTGKTRQANDVILKTDLSASTGYEVRLRAAYTAAVAGSLVTAFDGAKSGVVVTYSGTGTCTAGATVVGAAAGPGGPFGAGAAVCTTTGAGAATVQAAFTAQDLRQVSAVSVFVKESATHSTTVRFTDDGGAQASSAFNPVNAKWQQMVFDITGVAAASKDVVTILDISFTAAGAAETVTVGGFQLLYDYAKVNLAASANMADGILTTLRNDNNSATIAQGVSSITSGAIAGFVVFAPTQANGDFVIPAGTTIPTSLVVDTTALLTGTATLSTTIPLGSSNNGVVTTGNVWWYDGSTVPTTSSGTIQWVNANPNTINGNSLSYN